MGKQVRPNNGRIKSAKNVMPVSKASHKREQENFEDTDITFYYQ